MASTVQRQYGNVSCSDRRYPIEMNLEYEIVRGHEVLGVGRGRTVNMSSSSLAFKPEYPITVGLTIEAYVDWPARLDDVIALRLHVDGEIIGTENGCAAVRILRHEFRTWSQNRPIAVSGREDVSISSVEHTR